MQHISILAGNPMVSILQEDVVAIEPQIHAFEMAMRLADVQKDAVQKIAIALDYKGARRKLVDPEKWTSLSRQEKKHPHLASLRSEIRSVYLETAGRFGIDLSRIEVIQESNCFSDIRHASADPEFYRAMTSPSCVGLVSCQGVTASIIRKLAPQDTMESIIHTFWEKCDRVFGPTITKGTQLAFEKLGVRAGIIETMIDCGRVSTKEYLFDEETGRVEMY